MESKALTIGVDFQTVVIDLGGERVKLTVWDITGQKRLAFVRDSFYRGSRAVALAFDVSDLQSFYDLPRWRDEVWRVVPDTEEGATIAAGSPCRKRVGSAADFRLLKRPVAHDVLRT